MRKKLLLVLTIVCAMLAMFVLSACSAQYELSISTAEGGVAYGEGKYKSGKLITLEAVADDGYSFNGWYDGFELVSSEAEYVYTMPQRNVTLICKFEKIIEPVKYTLEIDVLGQGNVAGQGEYFSDVTVKLKAYAYGYYTFEGWYEDGTLLSKETSFNYIMPEKNVTVTAVFVEMEKYLLTIIQASNGTIIGVEGEYYVGNSILICVAADPGYLFYGWLINGERVDGSDVFTFTMPEYDIEVSAVFVENRLYTLTFDSAVNGCIVDENGSIISSAQYFIGDEVTLFCEADEMYAFYGWYFNDEFTSGEAVYTFTMPAQDITVSVQFVVDGFNGGAGTEDNPYTISEIANLVSLSDFVNSGRGAYTAGLYFSVICNIELEDEWTPIGHMLVNNNYARAFQGRFLGNDNVISGITVTGKNHASTLNNQIYAGLFGYTYNAVISDLKLTEVYIDILNESTVAVSAASVASYAVNTTVTNCHAEGSIVVSSLRTSLVGGIVGYNRLSTASDCSFDGYLESLGNVTGGGTGTITDCGGIVGFNDTSTVINCFTQGALKANSVSTNNGNGGGIVARNTSVVENCTSTMDVEVYAWSYTYAGGIVGFNNASSSIIRGCSATGDVYSVAVQYCYAGGIVGLNSSGLVEKCSYLGDIFGGSPTREAHVGGIVGNNGGTVKNCYSAGEVYSYCENYYTFAGGIAGVNNGTVENCYSTNETYAECSSNAYSGGIAGVNSGEINNCLALGNIFSYGKVECTAGSVIGIDNYGSYSNCYFYIAQEYTVVLGSQTTHEATNGYGESADSATVYSVDFYVNILGWSEDIWDFTQLDFEAGILPTLLR